MVFLGANLKFLRKQQGLTQEQLAGKIGVKRPLIGAYEEGRVEPKLQTILTICHYFSTDIHSLVNTDLSMDKKPVIIPDISGRQLRILPIAVNRSDDKEMSTIVPVKATAGYMKGYGDVDYIENLPKFSMPFPELPGDRTYRLFQISGDSMLPVPAGAYIICEYVMDWNDIKNEECYVLVTRDEGVVYKRVINNLKYGELVLKSDNSAYSPYAIKAGQLIEVWQAKGYASFGLPDSEGQLLNVEELTQTVMELKEDMQQLKKKLMEEK